LKIGNVNSTEGLNNMKKMAQQKSLYASLLAGFIVCLLTMILFVGIAGAAPDAQEGDPGPTIPDENCKDCHLDVAQSWTESPHAHAFDDTVFQSRWQGLGNPGDCLLCHTTNYQASTNSYTTEGVSCEACHGQVSTNHPPEVVPIRADTEYCGTCHTTTLHEWRLTGHASADVGCMDCHDPHSQQRLFEASDNLCINCHQADMEDYLEDLHVQKGIGCVDCHALVIPPDPLPEDGIVPTGHTFTITPATCVACHTDALHSGFHLPGYEQGAKSANADNQEPSPMPENGELIGVSLSNSEISLTAEQQIQTLEARLASVRLATLFQGGVVGLVLGGTTAWFVAQNVRARRRREEAEDEEVQDA
jgi:predicted CXXCH cytochrome family protein